MDEDRVARLRGLFRAHSCDKWLHGYERLYAGLVPPRRMLEVGVFRGESLRAWKEFWPDSEIVVMDTFQRIPPDQVGGLADVEWHRHDSREPFGPADFDLIIDDGDHHPAAQLATFENLSRNLAPGGRYVIEDVWPWDRMNARCQQNALKIGVCAESWGRLMDAVAGHDVKFHDFREGGRGDSFIIEIVVGQRP